MQSIERIEAFKHRILETWGSRAVSSTEWLDTQIRIRSKANVRWAVRTAISDGVLSRGLCEECGRSALGHHDDYNRPFSIRWLCHHHHAIWHRQNRPIPFRPSMLAMCKDEYYQLGLSQLARDLVRDIRTIRRWKTGESPVPKVVVEWLADQADHPTLS